MDFKWKLWILEKGKTKYTIYKGIWKVVNINYTMVNSFLSSFNVFIQQKINVLIKINALGHKSFCKHPFMISKLLRTVGASLEVLKAEIHYINMWLLDKVASIDSLGMFAQKKVCFLKTQLQKSLPEIKKIWRQFSFWPLLWFLQSRYTVADLKWPWCTSQKPNTNIKPQITNRMVEVEVDIQRSDSWFVYSMFSSFSWSGEWT